MLPSDKLSRVSRRRVLQVGAGGAALGLVSTLLGGCAETITDNERRIISLGGDLTEIIAALGAADRLVARDTTSLYPAAVTALPDVGYVRSLGTEGVLSLAPNLIIASAEAGPPDVIAQIQAAGVTVITPTPGYSPAALYQRITEIGAALDVPDAAAKLSGQIQTKMTKVQADIARGRGSRSESPRVVFLLNARDGSPMAAGSGTAANAMITLCGGENIFQDQAGYKPVSYEALADAQPDVIMMMDHSLAQMGGIDGIVSHPALRLTRAAKNRRIVAGDGLFLLGFGPRLPEATGFVAGQFYPELDIPDAGQ